MILEDYRDYTAYAVLLRRDDGAEYYACDGIGGHTVLFWRRNSACAFRDELKPHINQKGHVVKARVRIDLIEKE